MRLFSRGAAPLLLAAAGLASGQTYHSIGNPTDEEQWLLEMINRARANPRAEGIRHAEDTDPETRAACAYWGVDFEMMKAEFALLPVRPPLAMNAKLLAAARGHSNDMLAKVFQSHTGSDGKNASYRVNAAGYTFTRRAENIHARATSAWFTHASLQIEWGPGGTGGMQAGRSHRVAIHGDYREAGIGLIRGTNSNSTTSVGPVLVTEDLATSTTEAAFITGVAYHDFNGNAFYDPGEGIGGLEVTVSGVSTRAITTTSGGYAIPVPVANAIRTVTFTGRGLSRSSSAIISNGANVKVDYIPIYNPPALTGPENLATGVAGHFTFTPAPGADTHQWFATRLAPALPENCDSLGGWTAIDSAGGIRVSTSVKDEGAGCFQIASSDGLKSRSLTSKAAWTPATGAELRFRSRLGLAASTQKARVLGTVDNGASWTPLWEKSGTNSWGETAFTDVVIPLSSFAGRRMHLRFEMASVDIYYPLVADGAGWYIDNLRFVNMAEDSETISGSSSDGRLSFGPAEAGAWSLWVRPSLNGVVFPSGPVFSLIIASPLPPVASWIRSAEATSALTEGTLGTPTCDPNLDGIPNLAAYAMGAACPRTPPPLVPRCGHSGNRFSLEFREATDREGVDLVPEVSTDLRTWHEFGDPRAPAGCAIDTLESGIGYRVLRARVTVVPGQSCYLRLRATEQP